MALSDIVRVRITRTTRSIARAGFGVPMVLGPNAAFEAGELHRFYTSIAGVAEDFATNTPEYKAAARLFGQANKPRRIAIGKRSTVATQVVTITPTVVNDAVYTVTIAGVEHTYTADNSATAAKIVTGLIAAINADAACPVTASGTVTLILTAKVAGTPFAYEVGENLAAALTTANNGVQEDLNAISAKTEDWYALILTSRTKGDILNAAEWIESHRRIFIACTADADVLTNVNTDVASLLKAKSYARTAFLYSSDQASMPEAAWCGDRLPLDPGAETWRFVTLVGITPDNSLTTTQVANLKAKYATFFETTAAVNVTNGGKVAANEWIDTIRFCDWFQAQVEEGCFAHLVSAAVNGKIPYTDAGAAGFEGIIRNVQRRAIRVGGLANDPAPTVTVPLVADQDQQDRQDRFFPGIEFDGKLAGAIHELEIDGRLSA